VVTVLFCYCSKGYQRFQWPRRNKSGNGCICQRRQKKFRLRC